MRYAWVCVSPRKRETSSFMAAIGSIHPHSCAGRRNPATIPRPKGQITTIRGRLCPTCWRTQTEANLALLGAFRPNSSPASRPKAAMRSQKSVTKTPTFARNFATRIAYKFSIVGFWRENWEFAARHVVFGLQSGWSNLS
ncbi:hypothetical protein RGR602_CH02212 [Rhizobium gallicum bv. gallicum R602sp]|uniref:Uncharacterized protein n=1 Tax=Rhizobium gallicum bv. gallicum R602sp TaxID=1041138 RepID=A0A0B4X4A1_9HYPH|nr:hypothetical protein RGR602_CH02212 [Rhizobium gallicum bv. gallicum R602sp]